jgi:NAD(P)-dependent dehydrogenase (short-subunit alcohol dehydrogenase family)/acyl carrier protein
VAYDKQNRLAFRIRQEQYPAHVSQNTQVIRNNGAYLITGGLGGLGLAVAEWMGQQGAGKIVLTTRSQSSIDAARPKLNELRSQGILVEIVLADVADRDSMQQLINSFGSSNDWPTLRGVFHLAMGSPVVGDSPRDHSVDGMQPAKLTEVLSAKVVGSCILRELTRDLTLDFLLVFSSTASLIGASHLSHYAAANSFVDTMANLPNLGATPFLAINWGHWETMRAASAQMNQVHPVNVLLPMKDAMAVEWIGKILSEHISRPIIARVDWQVLAPLFEARRKRLWLEHLRHIGAENRLSAGTIERPGTIIDTIEELEFEIRRAAARVLGLRHGALPDSQTELADLGLDSLMAVTLRNRLQQLTGHSLPSTFVFEYPTTAQMASALDLLMWGSGDPGGTPGRSQVELRPDPLHPFLNNEERDEIRI